MTLVREDAEIITWLVDGLLCNAQVLPSGLVATLRAYREGLLRECAQQSWARVGNPTRCGRLADTIQGQLADGTWRLGERMPSTADLAEAYRAREKSVRVALFILTVRGSLARDRHTYYALPLAFELADIDISGRDKS